MWGCDYSTGTLNYYYHKYYWIPILSHAMLKPIILHVHNQGLLGTIWTRWCCRDYKDYLDHQQDSRTMCMPPGLQITHGLPLWFLLGFLPGILSGDSCPSTNKYKGDLRAPGECTIHRCGEPQGPLSISKYKGNLRAPGLLPITGDLRAPGECTMYRYRGTSGPPVDNHVYGDLMGPVECPM